MIIFLTLNKFQLTITDMITRPVKIKIKRLLKKCGGYTGLARELDVALSYVYRLEKGTIPGKRLYRDIDNLYRELFK